MPMKYRNLDKLSNEDVAAFRFEAKYEKAGGISVVAMGDSWFDYAPGTDIVDCLRYFHGMGVENHSKGGDTLENMVYGTGCDRDYHPTEAPIDSVMKRLSSLRPKAFLFSGGGNDIAGQELATYLNHSGSELPPFREEAFRMVVLDSFRKYYRDLLARVRQASPGTVLITHGYGHTLPTGIGVRFFGYDFAGPWLMPSFAKKRIDKAEDRKRIAFALIDIFNEMLASLAREEKGFVHIDLREELDPGKDWVNELHLRNSAYKRMAGLFQKAIAALP
jgi:hypothetical protein